MRPVEITEAILGKGLRSSVGATPAATVGATISSSIKHEGTASPFVRVAPGEYALRDVLDGGGDSDVAPPQETSETDDSVGIVHAFGMYWHRDLVRWTNTPALLGRQQIGADPVDFCQQRGVYLLHDSRETVYVGRSVDRPLGRRLYEHTLDRLRGRWNRFSWFRLYEVTDAGELLEPSGTPGIAVWIATMEALLIEGLEPRQNRRRGDDFSAVEYLQAEDPEIERQQMMNLLSEMQTRLNG